LFNPDPRVYKRRDAITANAIASAADANRSPGKEFALPLVAPSDGRPIIQAAQARAAKNGKKSKRAEPGGGSTAWGGGSTKAATPVWGGSSSKQSAPTWGGK